jgi:hypothetical protein
MTQQIGENVKCRVQEFIHLLSSNTAVCHNRNNPLANCSQMHCGLPSSALRWQAIHLASSDLWQSAVRKFY